MKFQIEAVWTGAERVVERYAKKAKPFEIKLEKIEHSTWDDRKHLIDIATIEINSLEELMLLCSKVDFPLIVSDKPNDPEIPFPTLEIYDDYRE